MGNYYGKKSLIQRANACKALQEIFDEVLPYFDHTLKESYRGEKKQNEAYRNGYSQIPFPKSKHNVSPSLAIDVQPYPKDTKCTMQQAYYFAGFVKAIAIKQGKRIRTGLDWDGDNRIDDETFVDAVHFEIDTGKASLI